MRKPQKTPRKLIRLANKIANRAVKEAREVLSDVGVENRLLLINYWQLRDLIIDELETEH